MGDYVKKKHCKQPLSLDFFGECDNHDHMTDGENKSNVITYDLFEEI